jgi:hypothetical protein
MTYPHWILFGEDPMMGGGGNKCQILITKLKAFLKILFLHPEYSRMISKNSPKKLKYKFIITCFGSTLSEKLW